jgi:hypothetical protein
MPAEVHDRKRYPQAVDPAATDGRGIDMSLGTLSGEAAEQDAKREAEHVEQLVQKPWTQVPSVEQESPTYYDRPVLKESVWSVDIPLYYYVGGAAGRHWPWVRRSRYRAVDAICEPLPSSATGWV